LILAHKTSNLLQFTQAFDGSCFIFVSLGRSLNTPQTSR